MGVVSIKNERFFKYLRYKLNKDKIEVDDLYTITEITLNKNDFKNEITDFEIDGIKYFKNLNKLYIKNFKITNKIIKEILKLKKLEKLVFFSCDFDKNIKIGNKLENLEILKCSNVVNIKSINANNVKISNIDIDFKFSKILYNCTNIILLNTFIGFDIGNNYNKKIVINFKRCKNIKIINSRIEDKLLFKFKYLENINCINTILNKDLKAYMEKNDKKKKIGYIFEDEYIEFTKEKGDANV